MQRDNWTHDEVEEAADWQPKAKDGRRVKAGEDGQPAAVAAAVAIAADWRRHVGVVRVVAHAWAAAAAAAAAGRCTRRAAGSEQEDQPISLKTEEVSVEERQGISKCNVEKAMQKCAEAERTRFTCAGQI